MTTTARRRRLVAVGAAALFAATVPAAASRAASAPGAERQIEQLERNAAQACRFPRPSIPTPESACSAIDGRVYSEDAMLEYEASWIHRALRLQAHLDDGAPLRRALFPATHNSFNTAHQPPTLSGLDHNQVASLTDQLRMDMRSLELDVHWSQSATGDPAAGMRAPVVCHAEGVDVSLTTVHVGCTSERDLRDALAEIRRWLDANSTEFLLLYLENALDGDLTAHNAAAAAIEATLGGLVYRPAASCEAMPTAVSKHDIAASGARVLIVGNCGPGAWGGWVHDRGVGTAWEEDKSGDGDDFVCPAGGYATFRRFYEDSTWLSSTVEPTGLGGSGEITAAETRAMVACGVNLFGFDQLVPADPRLDALVWSWATNEPSIGTAAVRGTDGRFRSADPAALHPYACRDGATWRVTTVAGAWSSGAVACTAEFPGSEFGVPWTGADNASLASASSVWVDYSLVGGEWTAG